MEESSTTRRSPPRSTPSSLPSSPRSSPHTALLSPQPLPSSPSSPPSLLPRTTPAPSHSAILGLLAQVECLLLDAQRTHQRRSAVLEQCDAAVAQIGYLKRIRIITDDSEMPMGMPPCAGEDHEPEVPAVQRQRSRDDEALIDTLQRRFQAESRKRQIGYGHVAAALELARDPAPKPKRDGAWWKSFHVPEGGARTRIANDYGR